MTKLNVFLRAFGVLFIVTLTVGLGGCGKKSAAPAGDKGSSESGAPAISDADAATMLRDAFGTMKNLTSFQIKSEITTGGNNVTIDGSFGTGSLSLTRVTDGKTLKIIAVDGKSYQCEDGATWVPGDLTAPNNPAVQMSQMMTLPLAVADTMLAQSNVHAAGQEDIDGEKTTHLIAEPKSGTGSKGHFWIATGKAGKEIRRLQMDVEATDLTMNMTNTYTKLNEPVTITAPQ